MENSTVRKIEKKSGLSAIYHRKIENFRFIDGKIGREQHALGGALTEGEIAVFSTRKSIYRRVIGRFFGKNPGKSWPSDFLLFLIQRSRFRPRFF